MEFLGLFYARDQRALMGLHDAPYHMLGRHALCARGCVSDGGAMACALGRLRNAAELRVQLERNGLCPVDCKNQAALALSAYRLWGEEYPSHLEGPVCTAVIDQDAGRLVLTRDAMGEQPVFYASRGSTLAFADHPSALLEAPFVSRTVAREGLCELFGLGPARTPGRTPWRDVRQLEPGCALIADGHGHKISTYFKLEAHEHDDDERRTIQTVRQLCEQAMADVALLHPASMLSGGLDSTVLTALACAQQSAPVSAYSVDYEDNALHFAQNAYQPERDAPYVAQAVSLLNVEHQTVVLGVEELADGLDPALELRGLPGMADIDSSLMLFARAISPNHQHVLSGECADEVFGGYPWFMREELLYAESFPWSGSLALRESVLKKSVREKLDLSGYVATRYHESVCGLPRLSSDSAREAQLRQLHGLCFKWFMPVLQERAQRMCAACGLNVLTPFCDERLVRYLYNVPWQMKTMGGQEKGLLRAAMRDLLPDSLLYRKKSPYPKTYHPRYTQKICERMNALIERGNAPLFNLVDAERVQGLMRSGLSPAQTPWFGQLMAGAQMLAYLLQVNHWLEHYDAEIDL